MNSDNPNKEEALYKNFYPLFDFFYLVKHHYKFITLVVIFFLIITNLLFYSLSFFLSDKYESKYEFYFTDYINFVPLSIKVNKSSMNEDFMENLFNLNIIKKSIIKTMSVNVDNKSDNIDSLISKTVKDLEKYGDKITEVEKDMIIVDIQELSEAKISNDLKEIKLKTDALLDSTLILNEVIYDLNLLTYSDKFKIKNIDLRNFRKKIQVLPLDMEARGKHLEVRGALIVFNYNDKFFAKYFLKNLIEESAREMIRKVINIYDMSIEKNYKSITVVKDSLIRERLIETEKGSNEYFNLLEKDLIFEKDYVYNNFLNENIISTLDKEIYVSRQKTIVDRFIRPISIGISNLLSLIFSFFFSIIFLIINGSYKRWKNQ